MKHKNIAAPKKEKSKQGKAAGVKLTQLQSPQIEQQFFGK